MKILTHILFPFILILALGACQDKDLTEGIYEIEIYLTDDPLNAEEVNIEILGVILIGMDEAEPIELNTISGIYNLLDFQGDVDTLIASGNYDLSTIREIRLILGENNTIKIDGQIYPLSIPSGDESGLKIKINKNLIGESLVSLLLDFDACASVKEINGEYKLSPIIHFKGDRNVRSLDVDYVASLDSCYTITFPVDAKDVNGEVIKISSSEELFNLILNETITGVVYPIIIVEEDGKERKINNHNQAEKWINACNDAGEVELIDMEEFFHKIDSCFTIEYPVSLILEDGSVYEVNSDEGLVMVDNAVEIVYPIYLNNGEEIKKINNENQLEAQLKNCEKEEEEEEEEEEYNDFAEVFGKIMNCYELSFPLTVELNDSSQVEVMNLEDLNVMVADSNVVGFVYDITITSFNGTVHVVRNKNQLKGLLNNCKSGETESELLEKTLSCYTLVFPIKIELESGDKINLENKDQLQELFDTDTTFEIKFPINLKDSEENEIMVPNVKKLSELSMKC